MTEATEKTKLKPGKARLSRRTRRTLWVLSIIFFLLLAIFAGLVVGYIVLGHQSWNSFFKWGTWKHVYDLVFAP